MILKRLTIATALLLAPAIGHATRNPVPPPSGIVIHLFGPNSIMSNVVPDLPGETPTHVSGQSATPDHTTSGALSAANSASDSVNTSTDPSWGAIAHQMFVTGDPNDPNKPASGRPGERLPASQ